MDFPFGPLAPDRGENSLGYMMDADGVIPLAEGYGPFPDLVVATSATALSGSPRGVFSYQDSVGAWHTVAGTASTIETIASDYTWSSIDTGLACTTGDDFCFMRFGTKLLYTNTFDGLRAYDVDLGGAASAVSAAKAPRWIFECGNIVFGLDCLDSAGARSNKLIRSSAFSDHTNWTTKGADYQPIETGGALIWGGKLSDTAALVLQQRAVRLIQVGNVGGALWGLQSVSEEFGAVGAKSVVSFDGSVYWLATDGFRRFSLGGGLERIGAGAIDQWFLNLLDQSDMSLVQGTIDPFRKCVLWRWKRAASADNVLFQDIVGFSWQFNRWFTITIPTTYLCFAASAATTWDSFSGTWDGTSLVWDARALQGGQPLLGAMDSTYKFGYFAGTNLAATLETAIADNEVSGIINWGEPVDDSDDGTLSLGVKVALNDDTTWKTGVAKATSGRVPLRGRGRKVAFRREITEASTWTYAKGVNYVKQSAGGVR